MLKTYKKINNLIDSLFIKYFNLTSPCRFCLKRPICYNRKNKCEDLTLFNLRRRKKIKTQFLISWIIISIFYFGSCFLVGITYDKSKYVILSFCIVGFILYLSSTFIGGRFIDMMDNILKETLRHNDFMDSLRYSINSKYIINKGRKIK